jgi:hypothetical protein
MEFMLASPNWRPHLVAAVAVLCSENRERYSDNIWEAFDSGSWVAPQLAVALSYCDRDFVVNAKNRILNGCPVMPPYGLSPVERHSATGPAGSAARSGKNMSSLIEMLTMLETEDDWLSSLRQEPKLKKVLSADIDDSAGLTQSWMTGIRQSLIPLEIKLELKNN